MCVQLRSALRLTSLHETLECGNTIKLPRLAIVGPGLLLSPSVADGHRRFLWEFHDLSNSYGEMPVVQAPACTAQSCKSQRDTLREGSLASFNFRFSSFAVLTKIELFL